MSRSPNYVSRQALRLLDHLRAYGSVEPLTALRDLGIYRLSARIMELRDYGHKIESQRTTNRNQFGEPCSYATYTLIEEALAQAS